MNSEKEFLADAVNGLSAQPRTLPCKYLYDARGSELFEAICRTEDYYVTRADLALMKTHLDEIVSEVGDNVHVIEFGSGEGMKTRLLLDQLENPRAYTPIEISKSALEASARDLENHFPELDIRPHQADYTRPVTSSVLQMDPPARRRLVYFPGSTISNFTHDEARDFLTRMGRIAGDDGLILIGVDLVKAPERLVAAYDDREGITAAFNMNLLDRMNRELGADFDKSGFHHEARWNDVERRIEMHLVAQRPMTVRLGDREFEFEKGQSIHTESSHKYSIEDFRKLAESAGLICLKTWTDPEGLFSTHLLKNL